jgi:hypothetical protein
MGATRRRGWLLLPLALAATAAVPPSAFGFRRNADGDGRSRASQPASAAARAAIARNGSPAVRAFAASLGSEGIASLDPSTGTPRVIARTDGFLTGRSTKPAARIALDYVRSHLRVFGLTSADLGTLALRSDYVSIDGTHHLSFVQSVAGIPLAANGLKANVTRDGRLVNLLDAPVHALRVATTRPSIAAWQARDAARRDLGAAPQGKIAMRVRPGAQRRTLMAGGDQARLVLFHTATGTRLAWQTFVRTDGRLTREAIDGIDGRVLERRSLSDSANGLAWAQYPGAPRGGTQVSRDFTGKGWLPAGATTLSGNNSHAFADVNDDNAAQPSEEVPAQADGNFNYRFTPFNLGPPCSSLFPCSWDPSTPFSWQRNVNQTTTQVFFYANNFHDHLAAAPIGFTEAAGNFQNVNASGQGKGGDAVSTQVDDGANTDLTTPGFPDVFHIDNANMDTPPDGTPPTMQMYLFHFPGTTFAEDPFSPVEGGDHATIAYHEYTHGLSNRLVVDPLGNSTLGDLQAGAMGEAWSDWYAFDFLVNQGFIRDTSTTGELDTDAYVAPGVVGLVRTEGMDCPLGVKSRGCPEGGYTYADYAKIIGIPEVHADGEIWGQTLWDLRTALGSRLTESLVTRAMELSPTDPSFLDERNAILQADQVVNGGRAHATIWRVFARRGMGFFAGSIGGDDIHPLADFSLPPSIRHRASVTGRVTDARTGKGIGGALVAFSGHSSGFADDLADGADRFGFYRINHVPFATYPAIFAAAPGYDTKSVRLAVRKPAVQQAFRLVRDWAAAPGGATVTAFDGPDFTPVCGPAMAIDQSAHGWGSTTDLVGTKATPKSITVKLPRTIDATRFAVDPSNVCGDDPSSATAGFRIETSRDGVHFTTRASGTFGPSNLGRLNPVSPRGGTVHGVRYVRFWTLGPQLPAGVASQCASGAPFSGCVFLDMTELEAYGAPSR